MSTNGLLNSTVSTISSQSSESMGVHSLDSTMDLDDTNPNSSQEVKEESQCIEAKETGKLFNN